MVTGASGFVGSHLCARLLVDGHQLLGTFRGAVPGWRGAERVQWLPWAGQALDSGLAQAIRSVDGIIHLVARTHVLDESAPDTLAAYREVNVQGTARLLDACHGVSRFLFMSSVKVMGEATLPGTPFHDDQAPAPTTPYGATKLEAERLIVQALPDRYTLFRPPLVYGPGVNANFLRLLGLIKRGLPLPLASVGNARSLVYVGNLVDALASGLSHPDAVGRGFLVADGEDLSTPELLRRLAKALGCPSRIFPFPPMLLANCARLLGRRNEAERLLGSLQLDASGLRRTLGWRPPYSVDQALAETAAWYLSSALH
jgi:nucleoside-diphosphate-sugar epimerase